MKATARGLIGVAIAAAVPLLYFRWWAKEVGIGESTWPCWATIAAGIAIAGWGALRPPVGTRRGDRVVAAICLALSVGFGGLFGWYTLGISYELPAPAWSELRLGRRLPGVKVRTPDDRETSLLAESRTGSLKGRKLLLTFFRGHW